MSGRRIIRIVLVLYWVAIFAATHIPQSKLPPTHVSDKLAHFLVYALLGALLWLVLAPGRRIASTCMWVLSIVLIYGAVDELTQPFLNRFCAWDDFADNAAGGTTAAVLMAMLWGRYAAALPSPPVD
jgi:VanZ family protein